MSALASRSAVIAVVAAVLFLSAVRLRLANVPLERDEGEYAYAGQLILQGIPPYQLAYNMKFPGTYYAYSLLMAIFGQTTWGIHVGLLVVNGGTIVLLFFLARRLLDDTIAAAISAIAFGFLSVDRWIMGVFGHATHFVVFAAVAGLLMLHRALASRRTASFFLAGCLLGISVLMKQNGIFFLILGIGLAFWDGKHHTSGESKAKSLLNAAVVTAGAAVPFVLVCSVLAAQGVLGKFWFWTFQYAREYVSRVSPANAWSIFVAAVDQITQANKLIWATALAGAVLLWFVKWSAPTRIFLTAVLAASFMSICPGFYFREHYFILLLPAAGLFCGVAVLSIEQLSARVMTKSAARTLAIGLAVVTLGAYVIEESDYLFSMPVWQLSRSRYGTNPFIEAPEIARYLQNHTDGSDRIAVMGSEPEIYFYANRKSATGYMYTYPLMERQKYSQPMQDEMIREITAVHPKYVLYVGIPASWTAQDSKERIFGWSQAYLNQCYLLTGVTEISVNGETRSFWDEAIANYKPQSPYAIDTFKAKSSEPCGTVE